ncbi:unnamed protein product [Periconia digitata]|uniref:Uncharacterized protein n=1 Tax=Periconia digitata TaxID=1303443 RepID=A0A9W4XL57_9PLEO|nr:unnamed protein product [Periconia digitata]
MPHAKHEHLCAPGKYDKPRNRSLDTVRENNPACSPSNRVRSRIKCRSERSWHCHTILAAFGCKLLLYLRLHAYPAAVPGRMHSPSASIDCSTSILMLGFPSFLAYPSNQNEPRQPQLQAFST